MAWRASEPLEDGACLIYALKITRREHCIAMHKSGDTMVVREDGITRGIMTHTWIWKASSSDGSSSDTEQSRVNR